MKTKLKLTGLAVLGALALHAVPASAQTKERSQELDVYGGWLFGDTLTARPVNGTKPEFEDHATWGLRYAYNFTDAWGLEASAGNISSSVTKLAGEKIDFDLAVLDLD